MEKHLCLTDAEFESLFANCSLNPAHFSHEAHLRLAWIHITKYGILQAIENIEVQLQNFVAHAGAKDKYSKTLTVAAIRAVYHFVLKSQSNNFADFIAEFPRLKNSFKELMEVHYGIDIFTSEKAKTEFIEPDLVPLTKNCSCCSS